MLFKPSKMVMSSSPPPSEIKATDNSRASASRNRSVLHARRDRTPLGASRRRNTTNKAPMRSEISLIVTDACRKLGDLMTSSGL